MKRLLIWCLLLAINLGAFQLMAEFPSFEGLRYRVQIENLKSVEISSGIFDSKDKSFNCRLIVETVSVVGKSTRVSSVKILSGKSILSVPLTMLTSTRSVFETTPLFRIDDGCIGFALRYGEGEYAFTRLFRISLNERLVSCEDLDLAGNVEKSIGPITVP